RAALQAYADGVNAFVAGHALPLEYAALALTTFEPWTPTDSVVVGKLISFGLSFDLDADRTQALFAYLQAGAVFHFDGQALFFEDLFRAAPFDPASTVPDATSGGAGPGHARGRAVTLPSAAAVELGRRWIESLREIPIFQELLDSERRAGSNEWGVSGAFTESGFPMIANDPHLSLGVPATFYPIHLTGGPFDVMGHGFAGAPLVILGQNADLAWGATTNPMDVTDTFQERIVPDPTSPSGLSTVFQGALEHVIPIPQVFRANHPGNGIPDDVSAVPPSPVIPAAVLIVPRRNQGPIVALDLASGIALSVQYTGFSATRELDAFIAWDEARNLGGFVAGLRHFDFGSQNWAVVDRSGNLGYFTSAEMPLREDLQAGTVHGLPPGFIRDGTGGNEWLPVKHRQAGQAIPYEILPPEEMPHAVNPPAGFFVNANNDPAGTTLDNDPLNQLRPRGGIYYLNPGYSSLRAGRITEMIRSRIASGAPISFEDMQRLQADVALLDAEFFVPRLTAAFERASGAGAPPALAALAADAGVAEAAARLAAWDFTTPTGIPEGYDASDLGGVLFPPSRAEIASSVAATIYALWRSELIRGTIDSHLAGLGLGAFVPDGERSLSALRHLLEAKPFTGVGASGVPFFEAPGLADPTDARDAVLLGALASALQTLASPAFAAAFGASTDQEDYRWGKLHRIVFSHPLDGPFDVPPAGGAFPAPLAGLPGIPTDGGMGSVDAASHDARAHSVNAFMFGSGPVRRAVAEGRRGGIRGVTSLPGGTSGALGSPFYFNLLPMWLTDEAFPVSLEQPSGAEVFSTELFEPARR
ncbi:MAG TPA: penicillin acylase family protein, partial [Anaeromyxobacteraceae bacterium]|nr:penicillin acylase family protein [Anaeromyxobacteraceae bacterium]